MATQAEVAQHLDLVQSAVADLVKRGVLPRVEPGALDIDECRMLYIRHLRAQAAGRAESELTTWRAELAKEQHEKIARENAVRRGELIPAAEVGDGLAEVIGHCRARLLAIPVKGAAQVAMLGGRTAEIREKLTELVHEALDELSRTTVIPGAIIPGAAAQPGGRGLGGDGEPGHDGLGAAAQADGEPVG